MALPMAAAAVEHVEKKSASRGSPHQSKGFLFHVGRENRSTFQRLIEYPTVKSEKTGMIRRMLKHAAGSGLV